MTEVRVEVGGRTLRLSNLDKVLYPQTGTTKGEILNYYTLISDRLLPMLADRCVTRIRWPHGVEASSFFEKNLPGGCPSWVRRAVIPTTGARSDKVAGEVVFPIVDDLATLIYLANLASLEFHVHQWKVTARGRPRSPDRLVIDLDPGAPAGLFECAQVALLVREKLRALDLDGTPVTSGSNGLHVYAAIGGRGWDAETVTGIAHGIAEELQTEHPKLVTSTMTKSRRSGKVFLDWSQNAASKTTVSPFSLRGGEFPYVAAPRTWDEIAAGAEDEFGLEQVRFEDLLRL